MKRTFIILVHIQKNQEKTNLAFNKIEAIIITRWPSGIAPVRTPRNLGSNPPKINVLDGHFSYKKKKPRKTTTHPQSLVTML